ncbi:MAG: hypothetical protein ABJP02_14210 [Parasphingorhabdus sp.]|uniref:hypothetical protein n=1 Tax=Parasphingorhabdus sp. TaxID=2709688 RepID=UPI0032994DB5
MARFFSIFMLGALLAAVPASHGATVHAQTKKAATKKTTTDGPAVKRVKKTFGKRFAAVTETVSLTEYLALREELYDYLDILQKQSELYSPSRSYRTEERRTDAAKRFADISAAHDLVTRYSYLSSFRYEPTMLSKHIINLREKCKNDEADQLLSRLRSLVRQYKSRSDTATLAGTKSKIYIGAAYDDYLSAQSEYKRAKNAPRKECEDKKNTGDANSGGEVVELDDIGGEPTAAPTELDPCERINGQIDPMNARDCKAWAPILGTWVNREYGGSITFRLRADRTVSAYIGSSNERMRYYGYKEGMEILNGWKLAGVNGATWQIWAKDGFEFAAKMPGRKPGQTFGQAAWNPSGMIFIDKKHPNAISLPGQLKWRLSNGTAWMRQ